MAFSPALAGRATAGSVAKPLDATDPTGGAGQGSGDTSSGSTDVTGGNTGGYNNTDATNTPTSPGGIGGALATLIPGLNANSANAIAQLLGIGGQIGGAALQQGQLSDAISYLKNIGAGAGFQSQTSYPAGFNAFANQNNLTSGIVNGTNPYASLLNNGVVGNIATLNGLLPGLTTGAGNLVYQDPTMAAYLGLSTGPINQLNANSSLAGGLAANGGVTGENGFIANQANSLAGMQNPLLSTGQAASLAVDQAARQNQAAAETARAQALARGGGAGAVAGAGAANGGLADFADAASGNISSALSGALTGQQGLNLQQVLGGLNAGQGAAALQQSLLNTGLSQSLNNALGVNQIGSGALNQLLAGRTGASNIGALLAQLYQGQNSQLTGAAGTGLSATLGAGSLMGTQGASFLNNAANTLGTQASTINPLIASLQFSPWATLLRSLGGLSGTPGLTNNGAGNSNLGSSIANGLSGVLSGINNASGPSNTGVSLLGG